MITNAGSKVIKHEADVVGAGAVWFDRTAVANIFGFSLLADKFRITYDNKVEDAFIVHLPSGPIKFKRYPDGLYRFQFPENYLKQRNMPVVRYSHAVVPKMIPCHLVATRSENRKHYTERQYERAKRA